MHDSGHKERHKPRYDAVLNSIEDLIDLRRTNHLKILEVGVEPFIFTEMLVDHFPNAEIYGIGYGEKESELHDVKGTEIEVRYCNVEEDEWPFGDDEFDVVTMMAILEHLFDPVAALIQARRVLDSRGRFMLTTPNAVRLNQRVTTLLGRNPFDGFPLESRYNRHQHEFTSEELADLLPRTGLCPVRLETLTETRSSGLNKKILEFITDAHSSIRDQIFVEAKKGKPKGGLPQVYRQGLIESRETHPLLDYK